MTIFKDYTLSPIALGLIVLILIFSGVTRVTKKKPTNLGALAISMIALGIILGSAEEWLGYTFFGVGLIASIVELVRNYKYNESKKTDN